MSAGTSITSVVKLATVTAVLVKVAREQGRAKKDAQVTFHVIPEQGRHGVHFDVGAGILPVEIVRQRRECLQR